MADISLDTADRVEVVESRRQLTCIATEAIEAGAPVRFHTDGKGTNAKGTDTTEMLVWGIALKSVAAGEPVTLLAEGILDGFDLSGLAYNAPVFLSDTDGRLADAAGTKAILIGRVVPGNAQLLGSSPDKLLDVNIAHHAVVS